MALHQPLPLTSPDNPHLKGVLRLRKHRKGSGLLIAEGVREVSRALAAGLHLEELHWSPELIPSLEAAVPELDQDRDWFRFYQLPPRLLRKIAYREAPEGVLGVFRERSWTLVSLGERPVRTDELWLVAAGVEKPGNLGAMARTCAAAGADGLLIAGEDIDPFSPNAIRSSTGAVFTLPVVAAPDPEIYDFLRRRRAAVVAATPAAGRRYDSVDLTRSTALVIGAEDEGVSSYWQACAGPEGCVAIPMAPGAVDSLNASNAAAVLLFEAVRQRGVPPLSGEEVPPPRGESRG
ncbi:MAG TPA: RNA methyltransferase [bacterium]|nr:RNA methyltransferase [bacterium]